MAQIPWGHNRTLLDKLDETDDRLLYAERAASEGWSRKVLEYQIATGLKGRKGLGQSNFSSTLEPTESDMAHPLDLSFVPGEAVKNEHDLENALLKDLETFMLNIGGELAFLGRQKELVVAGDESFIDLLFFHVGIL